MELLKTVDKKNKIRSGIIGHAIGDAMGVPLEGVSRGQLALHPVNEMRGYEVYNKPVGTWSDDTSMVVALIQSLISKRGFDYIDIMGNFREWWKNNEFTATGKTFIGDRTCVKAIENFRFRKNPLECGVDEVHSDGNGALMHILPVAYVCHDNAIKGSDRYALVRKVSFLTHRNETSVLACMIYVNIVCYLLDGFTPAVAYQKAKQDDYSIFSRVTVEKFYRILEDDISDCDEKEISSSCYALSSLEASLWCLLTTKNYKEAVLKAVNLGYGTATIGAITGAMAGLAYGYDSIPLEWKNQLQRRDYLIQVCDQFADLKIKA